MRSVPPQRWTTKKKKKTPTCIHHQNIFQKKRKKKVLHSRQTNQQCYRWRRHLCRTTQIRLWFVCFLHLCVPKTKLAIVGFSDIIMINANRLLQLMLRPEQFDNLSPCYTDVIHALEYQQSQLQSCPHTNIYHQQIKIKFNQQKPKTITVHKKKPTIQYCHGIV